MEPRRFILVCIAIMLSLFINADVKNLHSGLSIEEASDAYYVYFEMPEYSIVTDTLTDGTYDYLFSSIQFADDYFDYLDESGFPTLPFLSLDLILPPNVVDYTIRIDVTQTDDIVLPYDYTPAQMISSQDSGICFTHMYWANSDSCWYNRGDYDSHTYTFGKYNGLNFMFNPIIYDFYSRTVRMITEATITILFSYQNNSIANNNLYDYIGSLSIQDDKAALTYFDNFVNEDLWNTNRHLFNDNYLIITANQFVTNDALLDFAQFKASLGYYVEIVSLAEIGDSPQNIRSFIRNRFLDTDNSLNFVLLVGDVDMIPFSDGTQNDRTDPPTDIFYACIDHTSIWTQWYDLTPDVYVGRWPVQSDQQLRNIVYKTINNETMMGQYSPNRIAIFTGSGNLENYIYKDGKYIYDKVVCGYHEDGGQRYYSGDLFDGRGLEASGYLVFKAELEGMHADWPWMVVYSGHGNNNSIGNPFNVNDADLEYNIYSDGGPYQAFGFGFSCLLGNIYSYHNFARAWLTSSNGGVSFLGATTISFAEPDRYLSRKMFKQLEHKPLMTIGEFVANGISKYYNANPVIWRRRQAKKYVFYGDPSLYLYGLDFFNLTPVRKPKFDMGRNDSQNQKTNDLDILENFSNGENSFIQLFSISGQLIYSGDINNFNIQTLNNGMYFVVKPLGEKILTKKIYIK